MGDLSAYWVGISSAGDFLGTTPSYTSIRDRCLGSPGPERQPDAAAGALVDAGGAPDIDEGAQAILAPAQAPQPPLAAGPAQTMTQRLARVEEEVYEIQGTLGEQCEVMDAMARDLSRLTIWAVGGISQLLDSAGATYVRYSETHVPYQRRRVRQRTREASTSATSFDEDQPDP
ncbi:hypothetical protein Tco_0089827 [Tanacetum coccineum]